MLHFYKARWGQALKMERPEAEPIPGLAELLAELLADLESHPETEVYTLSIHDHP